MGLYNLINRILFISKRAGTALVYPDRPIGLTSLCRPTVHTAAGESGWSITTDLLDKGRLTPHTSRIGGLDCPLPRLHTSLRTGMERLVFCDCIHKMPANPLERLSSHYSNAGLGSWSALPVCLAATGRLTVSLARAMPK